MRFGRRRCDFVDIVIYLPADYGGIIALQVKNHPEVIPALLTRLMNYLMGHPNIEDYKGRLLLVEVHRIRIRK